MILHLPVRRPLVALLGSVLIGVVGCAKAPPPVPAPIVTIAAPPEAKIKAVMTITVSGDANPDDSGRASPIVVHVYQLKADGAFRGAEYFALLDDAAKTLGPSLITSDEFFLQAPDRRTIDVNVASDAAYVGVAAEFHQFRNAQWRAVVPAPRQGLSVSVEKSRVIVSAAQ